MEETGKREADLTQINEGQVHSPLEIYCTKNKSAHFWHS